MKLQMNPQDTEKPQVRVYPRGSDGAESSPAGGTKVIKHFRSSGTFPLRARIAAEMPVPSRPCSRRSRTGVRTRTGRSCRMLPRREHLLHFSQLLGDRSGCRPFTSVQESGCVSVAAARPGHQKPHRRTTSPSPVRNFRSRRAGPPGRRSGAARCGPDPVRGADATTGTPPGGRSRSRAGR